MKAITTGWIGVILIAGMVGCAKQPESRNGLNALPQWYQEPTVLGDKYAAAGSAKPNKAHDIELQKIEAGATARAELARMMSIRVKDMYKRASQELGSGEEQTLDHAVQYATKQITDVTLNSTVQKKLFLDSESGILYALYVIDPSVADRQLKDSVRSSFHDDAAAWQKFQSTQVWKELEGEKR